MKVLNRDQNISISLSLYIYILPNAKGIKAIYNWNQSNKFFKKSVLFGQLKKLVWRDMKLCSEDDTYFNLPYPVTFDINNQKY